jgi:hypothetical protein
VVQIPPAATALSFDWPFAFAQGMAQDRRADILCGGAKPLHTLEVGSLAATT